MESYRHFAVLATFTLNVFLTVFVSGTFVFLDIFQHHA